MYRHAGYLTVVVTDNGQGHELISALGQQIDADMQTQTGEGTTVTIKVPESALRTEAEDVE